MCAPSLLCASTLAKYVLACTLAVKSVDEALRLPLDTRSENGKAASFSSDSNYVLFPHRFLLEESWEDSEGEEREGEEPWEEREEERRTRTRTRTPLERYCLGDADSLKHVLPCLVR